MELTAEEQALIQAYREGADIIVSYFDVKTVSEATNKVNKFDDIRKISDLSDAILFSNFSASKDTCPIDVAAYLCK